MKKLFYFASLLAIAVGCNKAESPVPEVAKTFTLNSEIAQTKVAVDDQGLMTWQKNDEISLLSLSNAFPISLTSGEGTSVGIFDGSIDATPYAAVYPAGEHSAKDDGYTIVNLPNSYQYTESVTNAPMLAKVTTDEELSNGTAVFHHIGALVRVSYKNVPSEAESFTLTSDANITGLFQTNYNDSEPIITVDEIVALEGKTVTINFTEVQNEMNFYVPLPCGEYGFTVALKDADGNPIEGSTKSVSSVNVTRKAFFKTQTIELEGVENSLSLTNADITAALANSEVTNNSYGDISFSSAIGTWTANCNLNSELNYLQIRNKNASYLQSPELSSNIRSVVVELCKGPGESIVANRSIVAVPIDCPLASDADYKVSDFSDVQYGVSEKTVAGGETQKLTINFTKPSKQFMLVALGGAVYINSISVVLGDIVVPTTYNVIIDPNIQNGTVTASASTAIEGQTISLTVSPSQNYHLSSLSVKDAENNPVTVSASYNFIMPNSDVTVNAVFEEDEIDGNTVSFTNLGYESWGNTASFSGSTYDEVSQNVDGVSLVYTRNAGSLYANTSAIRFYKDNSLRFIAPNGKVITSIVWTGENFKADVVTDVEKCSSTTSELSWSGRSRVVTFKRPLNADSYITLQSVIVTLDEGEVVTLSSIAMKSAPTSSYTEGEMFDPTGLVITKIMSDGFDETVKYAGHESEFTFNPSLTTPLTTSDTQVTITYAGKTVLQSITVYPAVGSDPVTVTMTSFSAVSGNVSGDPNVTYTAAKGSASTDPAVNTEEVRIYQNGGTLTVTAKTGYALQSVTIGSSMATTIDYSSTGATATDQSLKANGQLTANGINDNSIVFICKGTDKNSRLYLNYLSVTYVKE